MNLHPLLVLAGGFGTRLQTVLAETPKPLAPIGDKPFLRLLVERWIEQGVREFIFLLHHKAETVKKHLDSWVQLPPFQDSVFRTLTEPQPLGTGGAVAYAVERFQLSESFLVVNADTWLSFGIADLARTAPPAMAVTRVANAERYGSVRIEQDRVTAFEEKRHAAGTQFINAGLYHLSPDLFHGWNGRPLSLERDLLPRLVDAKALRAVAIEADFIDIGIPDDYFRFCRWIESGKSGAL